MRIQANIAALNTHNRMKINQNDLTKTLNKLSSGYKINSAADDAAGLTISEGMRAQIRGLERAGLNAQDGLSLAYTTDAVVQEASQVVHRMRELTIQSMNDTLTSSDREIIQKEIAALRDGINAMAKDSRYNDTMKAVEMHESNYGLLEGIRQFEGAVFIDEGLNDVLTITANGQATTVQIPAGKYDPIEDLVDTLDTIIYDKNPNIIFSLTDDKRLTVQVENSPDIAKIKGSASSLFFDYEIGNKPGMIIGTTDYSTGDGKLQIHAGQNDTLSFYIGPTNKIQMTFPPGSYTRQQVVDHINQHISGTGAEASIYGDKNISISSDTYQVTGLNGNMFKVDGYTSALYDNIFYGNVSKTQSFATGSNDLRDGVTITSANQFLTIAGYTSNLTSKAVRVDMVESGDTLPKTYTATELVSYIQQKLDDADLQVKVMQSSNRLHLESKLYGNSYPVRITTSSDEVVSQILNDRMTSEFSPANGRGLDIDAKIYGKYANRQTMEFDSTNNSFKLKVDNIEHEIVIPFVPANTYQITDLVDYLNPILAGIDAGLSISHNDFNGMQSLFLTSKTKSVQLVDSTALNTLFSGQSIREPILNSGTTGAPVNPPEGTVGPPTFSETPAKVIGRLDLSSGITVTTSNNTLSFTLQGQSHTVTLAEKYYTKEELITALNVELSGKKAKAELSGNNLALVSEEKGSGVSFQNVQGLAMVAIINEPYSKNVMTPSKEAASVLGVPNFPVSEKITLTATNSTISFQFKDKNGVHDVSLSVPPGDYTPSALASTLNVALITNYPLVDVSFEITNSPPYSVNQFRLKSDNEGAPYQFLNLSGELYKDLFSRVHYTTTPNHYSGYSDVSEAYAVGRADLPSSIEIFPSTNDMLTFDIDYQGKLYTVDVQIPQGIYTPNTLATAFNNSLKSQLKQVGLPEDVVSAQIGVQNANQNVTNTNKFVLIEQKKDDGRNDNGQTVIQGVRGSAAYSIFYQSDGIAKPSYITGINDLSKGLTIEEGENDTLEVDVNNEVFKLKFPAGSYNADSLLQVINDELTAKNTGLIATYHENMLRFSYKENGMIPIDGITGNARDDLFFKTERREVDNDIDLQIGANANQSYTIKQTTLSDRLLRINTISVTTFEKAQKALSRLDGATNMITDKLGNIGAVQNRLERVLGVNQNSAENLSRAESTIRDADMAKEMMKFTKQNILSQAMQTMLAQATNAPQAILQLIK